MFFRGLLALGLITAAANAQPPHAAHRHQHQSTSQPSPISLTPEQQSVIRAAVRNQLDTWDCDTEGRDAKWFDDLQFQKVSLHPRVLTILASADTGCTRAGLGTNGAMWIVALGDGVPKILASPAHEFNGYFQSVETTAAHGYRDVSIAWNFGPTEDDITYFHFDGKVYRAGRKAILYSDDPEHGSKYVPVPLRHGTPRRNAPSR